MTIIIRYLLRNLREKKFRTFLIIFSIMVSSALYFASSSISGTLERIHINRMRTGFGSADILVTSGKDSPSSFFYPNQAEGLRDRMEYIIGAVNAGGIYRHSRTEVINLGVRGYDLDELQIMNPVVLEEEYSIRPFSGNRVIISRFMADKYGLKAGDYIDIEIKSSRYRFLISGIASPVGLFADTGTTMNCIVPRETLSSIYNARGRVTTIYLKPKLRGDTQNLIEELSNRYKNYVVRETITQDEIRRSSSGLAAAFMFMLLVVIFMSVFIIYTSFKVITMERLPVIGTFRSIGATRRSTTLILLGESTIYGVIGGLLGDILGIGVLYLIALNSMPPWVKGGKVVLDYSPYMLLISFLMAIVLSLISSIIPIIRTSRFSIKDIILNQLDSIKMVKSKRILIVIVLSILAAVCPNIPIREIGFLLDAVTMVSISVVTVLLVPYITELLIRVFEGAFSVIFGNEGLLAAKNLRNNKSILNNISLLAIGISTLLMINTISLSVQREVLNAYKDFKFDIMMYIPMADRSFETQLQGIEGIDRILPLYERYNVKIGGTKDEIRVIQGANKQKFLDFMGINFEGDSNEMVEELDRGRYIIVTTSMRDKMMLKKGDSLSLDMGKGKRSYQIIGFMKSMRSNGSYGLVSERYLKLDTGNSYYSDIYVKTVKPPEEVAAAIKARFINRGVAIETISQLKVYDDKSNAQLFGILRGFSLMAMTIGIFGVLNNFLISFIERKRSLAMMRSIGLSKGQTIKIIFVEALSSGIIGGSIGVLSGYILASFVPDSHIILEVAVPIPMHVSAALFVFSGLSGIFITLIASIAPAMKSSRLNIIDTIKYE